jgi:mycothiol synthase
VTGLPDGLVAAPLRHDDADAATRLWQACEEHDDGEPSFTAEEFAVIAQTPSIDLARASIGIRDDGELIALGLLHDERHAYAHVLPASRGRGIGSWLLRWTQEAGRAAGNRETGQTIPDGRADVAAMLLADGYTPRWHSWRFDIEIAGDPGPARLPEGHAIRDLVPGTDDARIAHGVIDEAFGEWPERDPWPFGDWAAATVLRPGFSPSDIALVEARGDVVGVAVIVSEEDIAWVDQLAVARAHRGKGLARALLMHAFGISWRAGKRHVGLSTDSRTGARGLYEKVGMHVRRSFTQYARAL